jgi:hypothetical protein
MMVVPGRRLREGLAAQEAPRRAKEQAERDAQKARAEQYERKLIRMIEEQDAKAEHLADPPPELSPSEVLARESAERLDRLEGKEQAERMLATGALRVNEESLARQNRLREQLRLLRNRLAAERLDKRTEEHTKRCGRQIKALEAQVSDIEGRQQAETERHRHAMDELNAEHTSAATKLGDLTRTLTPDETSEQRLQAVMG